MVVRRMFTEARSSMPGKCFRTVRAMNGDAAVTVSGRSPQWSSLPRMSRTWSSSATLIACDP